MNSTSFQGPLFVLVITIVVATTVTAAIVKYDVVMKFSGLGA